MIVLGFAFIIVGVLLLMVSDIVGFAVTAGCSSAGCPGVDPAPWFAWFGLPILVAGIVTLIAGAWLGLGRP